MPLIENPNKDRDLGVVMVSEMNDFMASIQSFAYTFERLSNEEGKGTYLIARKVDKYATELPPQALIDDVFREMEKRYNVKLSSCAIDGVIKAEALPYKPLSPDEVFAYLESPKIKANIAERELADRTSMEGLIAGFRFHGEDSPRLGGTYGMEKRHFRDDGGSYYMVEGQSYVPGFRKAEDTQWLMEAIRERPETLNGGSIYGAMIPDITAENFVDNWQRTLADRAPEQSI